MILIFETAYTTITFHVESILKVSASNFQRISIGYLLASISEIWFVNNIMVESLVDFARKYYNQWLVLLQILLMLMNLSGPYICFPFVHSQVLNFMCNAGCLLLDYAFFTCAFCMVFSFQLGNMKLQA